MILRGRRAPRHRGMQQESFNLDDLLTAQFDIEED